MAWLQGSSSDFSAHDTPPDRLLDTESCAHTQRLQPPPSGQRSEICVSHKLRGDPPSAAHTAALTSLAPCSPKRVQEPATPASPGSQPEMQITRPAELLPCFHTVLGDFLHARVWDPLM